MHRLTTSLLAIGVLAGVSCGAPAELDESLYPGPDETGYTDSSGTGTAPLGGGGASGQGANAGAGSLGAASNGGTAAPPANAASSASGGGSVPAAGGSAQAGAAGGASAPVGGGAAAGGCPDDITVLFDRPLSAGGCSDPGCHGANGTPPDLVSPDPASRLVGVLSTCNGRPFIGGDDSFLADKISGERPECGAPMPFLSADLLNDADRQCILDWIDEVSGG